MIKIGRIMLIISLLLIGCKDIIAQIAISGTVKEEGTGLALPGVNVSVKGTLTGVITDLQGNFQISVPSAESVLSFSYVGYSAQEYLVGDTRVFQVSLKEETEVLDEVVIVGYGKIKKSDLTGAVSSIKSESLKDMPVTGMDQALQGRAAGVLVTNNTGAPGSGVSIRVRGIGSIARSNEPLYVIDGIPLDNTQYGNEQTGATGDKINPMANINPSDIESIEVLKDPASCAIYGARGANGVVLITTKKGSEGKARIEVVAYYGISEVAKKLDLLNGEQYAMLVNEGLKKKRVPRGNWLYISEEEAGLYNTDWQDEIFRQAPTSNINMTVQGGNAASKYMISGGYYKQEGIVLNTGFDRMSFRSNLDFTVSERIKAGINLSVSHSTGKRQRNSSGSPTINSHKQYGGPVVMSALASSPLYPVKDSIGRYGMDIRNRYIPNPVMLAMEQNLDYFSDRLLGNLYAEVQLVKGLSFKSVLGADVRNVKENFFWGPYYFPDDETQKMPGSARTFDNNINGTGWVWTNTLNYDLEAGNHFFNVLLGHEASKMETENTYTVVGGMPIDNVTTFASSPALISSSNSYGGSTLESYFGRVNYSYGGKYLFQVNLRADGSSRFGPGNQWGWFPATSFGWNLAKEDFLSSVDWLEELKLRLSVGKTGNQEIGDFAWRGAIEVGTLPNAWDTDGTVLKYLDLLGGIYTSISDYGYSWEKQTQSNLGVDISVLRNRILFSADYYNKVSDDLLLTVAYPITTGISSAWNNAGKVSNSGFEFVLTTHNTTGALKWTTEFNLSTNKFIVNQLVTDSIKGSNTILIEGKSLHFYTYVREENVDSLTGYVKLVDLSGDGSISYGGGDPDKKITGNPLPDFFGGITNTLEYKGFDLSFFLQFVYGNQIYNATRQSLEDLQIPTGNNVGINSTTISFLNRYTDSDILDSEGNVIFPRNVHTQYPITNYSGSNTDQREGHNGWIEDGSYLRLKTLTLGYTLPPALTHRLNISRARIYFTSNNLFVWTHYSGFDPEVSTITGEGIGANLSHGIDAGAYPQARNWSIGINLSF